MLSQSLFWGGNAVGVALGLSLFSSPASSAIVNGSFEDGFNSWLTSGDASIQGVSFGTGPTAGTNQALLTNSTTSDGFNFSGSNPLAVGFAGGLENFLGIPLGSLDPAPNSFVIATEGTALKTTFTASAGDVLSLDWNFLTNDTQDYGFVLLTPTNTLNSITYGDLSLLNNSNTLVNSNTVFDQETGFQSFSYTFSSDGTFLLGLGVVDVGDTDFSSGVLVDNIALNRNSIPEPSVAVGLFSLVALALATKLGYDKANF
jgi:hypothetical protein